MKACATIYPIEYKTVRGSGSRASVESVDAGRPREPGGPNMLGAINFWKNWRHEEIFLAKNVQIPPRFPGLRGNTCAIVKDWHKIFGRGTGVGVPFWADRKWACQAKSTRGLGHRYLGSSCRSAMGNRAPWVPWYWNVSECIGVYRSVLRCAEMYRSVLRCTWVYWSVSRCIKILLVW